MFLWRSLCRVRRAAWPFFPWPLLLGLLVRSSTAPGVAAQTFLLHDKALDRRGYPTGEASQLYSMRLETNGVVVEGRYRTRYGELGRKVREGDRRTPEGQYTASTSAGGTTSPSARGRCASTTPTSTTSAAHGRGATF